MTPRAVCAWLAVVLAVVSVAGCQSPGGDSSRKPAEARAPAARPQHEFRQLRTRVPGKSMREVVALLGSPSQVFNMGDRESWDYKDAAYDSVTGRTVATLSIWFTRRVADDVQASF